MANKRYDSSVDIWAIGIVILQLLLVLPQNKVPDVRVTLSKDPDYVKRLLEGCDPKLSSICVACLSLDPLERPSATTIIEFIDNPNAITLEKKLDVKKETFKQEGISPLSVIPGKRAQEFWKKNKWEELVEIDYEDFKEAYFKDILEWKKMAKDQERGFKKLLAFDDIDAGKTKKTNCFKFAWAIAKCGFPFSLNILSTVEKYSNLSSEVNETKDYSLEPPMTEEQFASARDEYLQMVVDNDRIFVDPLTQETLSIDTHCAPLHMATDEEWKTMMETSYDMDIEDDKLLKLERLGMVATQKPHHNNALEFLIGTKSKRFIILGPAASGFPLCLLSFNIYFPFNILFIYMLCVYLCISICMYV